MIHITDKLSSGTPPKYVGVTFNENFTGTSLNSTNFSGALPTSVTINNKLIVATGAGATDWTKYIQFAKLHMYEKQSWSVTFKALDKIANGGWGLSMSSDLVSFNSLFYLKVDLSNGANSGRVSIGIDDTTATSAGYSQAVTWAAGDSLKLTIVRSPWKTFTILENLTTTTNPKAYGEFDLLNWGTQGHLRLSFLTGQQEFSNITINVFARNYQSLSGVAFYGDSITIGKGASTVDRTWVAIVMRGQFHLYENLGIGSWLSGTINVSLLTETLTAINPKYFVCNIGFNDAIQVSTSVFNTNLTAIVVAAQAAGCTVILVTPFANSTVDKTAYATVVTTVAAANSCAVVDAFTQTKSTGNLANSQYLYSDSLHPNDAGHAVIGNEFIKQVPQVYAADLLPAINNDDFKFHNLAFGNETQNLITIDHLNTLHRTPWKKFLENGFIILQATIVNTQTGGAAISGNFIAGGYIQSKSSSGLQLGFNNGLGTGNSSINITNTGTGGLAGPQGYDTISGLRCIKILATNAPASVGQQTISGNDNLLLQSSGAATLSGNLNTLIAAIASSLAGGIGNTFIGPNSGKAIAGGSYNIHVTIGGGIGNGNYPASLSNTIFIGDPVKLNNNAIVNGDIVICTPYGSTSQFWFGGKADGGDIYFNVPSAGGTSNASGNVWYERAAIGTGTGQPGKRRFQFSTPGASGATLHSAFTDTMVMERTGVTIGNATTLTKDASAVLDVQSTTQGLLLPRMTKTQRDAISTPAAGLAVYQTDNTPGLRVYNGTNWMKYTETTD